MRKAKPKMFKIAVSRCILVLAFAAVGPLALAADPSLAEVYRATNAGMYREAQGLMDQVLRDHPGSGKAHYVEAELLAKQGMLVAARAELATAERLAPGLPFAKPAAVQSLNAQLERPISARFDATGQSSHGTGGKLLWQLLLAAVGVVAIGAFIFRNQTRNAAAPLAAAGGPALPGSPVPAMQQGYGMAGYAGSPAPAPTPAPAPAPMAAPASAGMGSTILGGLATGAALGAGMVAGQALMHRVMDGPSSADMSRPHAGMAAEPTQRFDMGGDDFGIADASSWDDGGGAIGGDDAWS